MNINSYLQQAISTSLRISGKHNCFRDKNLIQETLRVISSDLIMREKAQSSSTRFFYKKVVYKKVVLDYSKGKQSSILDF